jgi:hypothetical protein
VPKKDASGALTPLEEKFAQLVVSGRKLADAYVEAGYARPKTLQDLWNKASGLRAKPNVAARIAQLRDAAASHAAMDLAWVLKRLRENDADAASVGDYRASNRALELIGRHLGIFDVKKAPDIADPTSLTDEDLESIIRRSGAAAAGPSARRKGAAQPQKGPTKH